MTKVTLELHDEGQSLRISDADLDAIGEWSDRTGLVFSAGTVPEQIVAYASGPEAPAARVTIELPAGGEPIRISKADLGAMARWSKRHTQSFSVAACRGEVVLVATEPKLGSEESQS